MKHITRHFYLGQKKYRRILLGIFVCVGLLPSCAKHEVITDEYYIHNDLDQAVFFLFEHPMAWDTCAMDEFVRVWYDSECAEVPAHRTIRLHPIDKDYLYPAAHVIEPGHLLGETTKLLVGIDTVVWFAKNGHMFTNDSVWSIYNTLDWKTEKDQQRPNTYYSTFTVTETSIKRGLKQ